MSLSVTTTVSLLGTLVRNWDGKNWNSSFLLLMQRRNIVYLLICFLLLEIIVWTPTPQFFLTSDFKLSSF